MTMNRVPGRAGGRSGTCIWRFNVAYADRLRLGRRQPYRYADGAYGGRSVQRAREIGGWSLELLRRPRGSHSFQAFFRRWVVDRTFA